MRIRVEYAWKAANAYFKLGKRDLEESELRFIVVNGGTLMLHSKASERLSQIDEPE